MNKEILQNIEINTDEQIANAIFLTFRFGQGDRGLQGDIFHFLRSVHPDWEITGKVRWSVQEKLEKRIGRYLHNSLGGDQTNFHKPMVHPNKDAEGRALHGASAHSNLMRDMEIFSITLNSNSPKLNPIPDIAKGIIDADHDFLCVRGGRPRRFPDPSKASLPLLDPWLSHFLFFGIDGKLPGHSTGLPEFDQMFAEAVEHVGSLTPETAGEVDLKKLDEVRSIYFEKSPNAVK